MSKSFNSLALLALIGAAMVSSCSKDTDLYDSNLAQKEYEANWTEKFGQVAADQDWNLATRGSVTVNVPSTTDVQIYAAVGDEYKCVGNFSKVSGTQTLNFDVVKGCEEVMVTTKSQTFYTKLGGTVDLGGTRTRAMHATDTGSFITVADANSEIELSSTDIFVYRDKLPESGNANKNGDNRDKEGVKTNFHVVSDGKTVTIYPIYWQTSQYITLGIYYYNNSSKVEVPVYSIKDSDASVARLFSKTVTAGKKTSGSYTVYYAYPSGQGNTGNWLNDIIATFTKAQWEGASLTDDQIAQLKTAINTHNNDASIEVSDIKVDQNWSGEEYSSSAGGNVYTLKGRISWTETKTTTEDDVVTYTSCGTTPAFMESAQGGKSKGINVTVPSGVNYGFYIACGDGNTYYSQASLNSDPYYTKDGTKTSDTGACHAAIYKAENGNTYLGFEDWADTYGDSDMDLNDLIVRVDGINPQDDKKVVDEDKTNTENGLEWIIACEDLGSTDDYDFNDVVVKVSYVAGDKTLSVTPLAAGGTLKANISFLGAPLGEIHKLLNGSTANADGTYPMINTQQSGSIVNTSSMTFGDSIPLGVQEDFTLSSESNSQGADNMGGFTITVSDEKGAKTIKAPTKGSVPQMFVVPGTWAWPTERTGIETAYPNFKEWVSNAADYEWWK